jgi:hypothetical protein
MLDDANAFGLLAFRPDTDKHPAYRAAVIGSFTTVSVSFTALATLAYKRRRRIGRR